MSQLLTNLLHRIAATIRDLVLDTARTNPPWSGQ